jgi:hypothetical protein
MVFNVAVCLLGSILVSVHRILHKNGGWVSSWVVRTSCFFKVWFGLPMEVLWEEKISWRAEI